MGEEGREKRKGKGCKGKGTIFYHLIYISRYP